MKRKKIIGLLAIAAVMAVISPATAGFTQMNVLAAEENQFAELNDIMRQIYSCYQSGDFVTLYDLDHASGAYADMVRNSGFDRYVTDLTEDTKAMMLVFADGGYYWYFGQTENNLRQGTGTTIAMSNSASYSIYSGTYASDLPSGEGKYLETYDDDSSYEISGIFQGSLLNGTYQVTTKWLYNGAEYSCNLPTVYENGHFKSLAADWVNLGSMMPQGDNLLYIFNGTGTKSIYFDAPPQFELYAVGIADDFSQGRIFRWRTTRLDEGLSIFQGNPGGLAMTAPANAPAPAPAPIPESTPVITPAPENTPAPEAAPVPESPSVQTPETYVVQRGDTLYKIAKKIYGDEKRFIDIYNANKDTIKSNYIIWANQTLIIPAK